VSTPTDTAASIRSLVQLLHGCTGHWDLNPAISALTRYADHLEKCAGVWVDAKERTPPIGARCPIISLEGTGDHGVDIDSYEDYREIPNMAGCCEPSEPHWWAMGDTVTHWLDVAVTMRNARESCGGARQLCETRGDYAE